MLKIKIAGGVIFCCLSFAGYAASNTLIDVEHYQSLTSDRHAVKVGDILTVIVAESSSAMSSVGTNAQNKTDFSLNASSLHGKAQASVGIDGSASGEGQTSRRGQLQTVMSVHVVDQLPNGQLKVEGTQETIVNNDKQYISVSGYIRPDDISYNNTIYSYRITDARIQINGKGVVNDSQHLSVFYKIFHWLKII